LPQGRGATLSSVLLKQTEQAALRRAEIFAPAQDASDLEELYRLSRRQHRLFAALDGIYQNLAWCSDAIGRQDIPVGLLHLIDTLAEQVLHVRIDALVILDPVNMYRCIQKLEVINSDEIEDVDADLEQPLGGGDDQSPPDRLLIFLLPALDACNMLLSPIITHEAAHSCVDDDSAEGAEQSLASLVLSPIDADGSQGIVPNDSTIISSVQDWVEELLCDAVATAITGPSHVFALAAFLPALTADGTESHPPTSYRIAACLKILDALGWTPFLQEKLEGMIDWMEGIHATYRARENDTLTSALVGAADFLSEEIAKVALAFTQSNHFRYRESLDPVLDAAVEALSEDIPPVEYESNPIDSWTIVLAGWMHLIRELGIPDALAAAPTDVGTNNMLLKAIELSSIQRLWQQS